MIPLVQRLNIPRAFSTYPARLSGSVFRPPRDGAGVSFLFPCPGAGETAVRAGLCAEWSSANAMFPGITIVQYHQNKG